TVPVPVSRAWPSYHPTTWSSTPLPSVSANSHDPCKNSAITVEAAHVSLVPRLIPLPASPFQLETLAYIRSYRNSFSADWQAPSGNLNQRKKTRGILRRFGLAWKRTTTRWRGSLPG